MRLETLVLPILFAALGCSSSSAPPADSGTSDAVAQDDAAAVDAGPTITLAAPTLDMVMPMKGGLHLFWTNKDPACETMEAERMSATEGWMPMFSVPVVADNKMDTTCSIGTEYTYRVRCKKGSDYSDYSSSKAGTRTQ